MQMMDGSRHRQHRRLLILQGEPTPCRLLAQQLLATLEGTGDTVIVTADDQHWPGLQCIRNTDYMRLLGKTLNCLVMDSFSGFSAETLAALSGCIAGGGCLIWLVPETSKLGEFADPECERLFAYPSDPSASRNAYLRYVLADATGPSAMTCWSLDDASKLTLTPLEASDIPAAVDSPLTEQSEAVQAILETAHSHGPSTLLVTADRGRGKSAALGLAAGFLLQERPLAIVVTSHHPDAVQTVFNHAAPLLSHLPLERHQKGERFQALQLAEGALRYLPPDELLYQSPDCDLLMIDEAAALPLSVLDHLLSRFPRVILATTLAGYEGSGQGFRLRFLPLISQRCSHFRELKLNAPIRWAEGDPLEAWVNRTLLCQLPQSEIPSAVECDDGFQEIDWSQHLTSPALIHTVFRLLALAHYRTTPEDLRLMLDSPALDTFIQVDQGRVVAIVLVAQERHLTNATLRDQCIKGERRPRGLLSPLAFLQQMGLTSALDLNMARIVRIVVDPDSQRQGLGRQCLDHLADHYQSMGFDLLTASFSLFPDVARFWSHCGFALARVGQRRDHVTATHSLLVARHLTAAGERLLSQAQIQLKQRVPFDLAYHWTALSDAELLTLLRYCAFRFALDSLEEAQVELFCAGALNYEVVAPLLLKLALDRLGGVHLSQELVSLWLWRCVRQHSWSWINQNSLFKGKAAIIQALRRSASDLLNAAPH